MGKNPSLSSSKESVPDLRYVVVVLEVIAVLLFSTHTLFIGVSCVFPVYESSLMIFSAHMRTGQRFVVVHHYVTVAFLNPSF